MGSSEGDFLRGELDVKPTDNEGDVVQLAVSRAVNRRRPNVTP